MSQKTDQQVEELLARIVAARVESSFRHRAITDFVLEDDQIEVAEILLLAKYAGVHLGLLKEKRRRRQLLNDITG